MNNVFKNFGKIVILNGVPRSGKSSIVREIQNLSEEPWMNLGVDVFKKNITPEKFGPGIGLRPGADKGELEKYVPAFFSALFASVAAHSKNGLNVVSDLGLHEAYSKKMNILKNGIREFEGLPVVFVGVRCPIKEIMKRRNHGQEGREGTYATGIVDGPYPESVETWQKEVHFPGIYDLEVDTSTKTPVECATLINDFLGKEIFSKAFNKIAQL